MSFESDIVKIVGKNNFSSDIADLLSYSRDSSPIRGYLPDCVVLPRTAFEVSEVLKLANKEGKKVVPRGGGTSPCGASIPLSDGCVIIDSVRLKGIQFNEEDMTASIKAGTTWAELIRYLKKFDVKPMFVGPHSGYSATIGGGCASSAIGYGSAKHGQIGDSIVTLEVVLPSGEIIYTGSAANPNAGKFGRYCNGPDLAGLFIGSHGIYGFITEVTLKVEPIPTYVDYFTFGFNHIKNSIDFIRELQKKTIPEHAVIYFDKNTIHKFGAEGSKSLVSIVIEEEDAEIGEAKSKLVEKLSKKYDAFYHNKCVSQSLWTKNLFDSIPSSGREGIWVQSCHRIPLSRLELSINKAFRFFNNKMKKYNLKIPLCMSATVVSGQNSNFVSTFLFKENDQNLNNKIFKIWDQWIDIILRENGGCPYWIGYKWTINLYKYLRKSYFDILWKLKKILDPNYIMYPNMILLRKD